MTASLTRPPSTAKVGTHCQNTSAVEGTTSQTTLAGQQVAAAHEEYAGEGPTSPIDQLTYGAHTATVDRGAILRDPLLGIMADAVDDLERTRIASENRYRQLTRTEADGDGLERGFGLTDVVPEVARLRGIVEGLSALEHQAVLALNRQLRKHPLWAGYAKDQRGVGEKQFARLLTAIGDPYWNDLYDRPRTVSELCAYCGYHVVDGAAPRRARGSRANWSPAARMRLWNITASCLKTQGGYAEVYYQAREKYALAVHSAPCVRCGPAGHPAPVGSPLSAAHRHARSLRAIGKTVLRDLWLASRAIHQGGIVPIPQLHNDPASVSR